MISACSLHNADGTHNCDINTNIYPLHAFDVTPNLRTNTGRQKMQDHGVWPTFSFRDNYEIHMEGDIFGTDSNDYFSKRQTLLAALFGVAGVVDYTNRKMGTLFVTFDGSTEQWKADYTITAFTAPLAALSPARSEFALTVVTWNPWFIGVTSGNKYYYA